MKNVQNLIISANTQFLGIHQSKVKLEKILKRFNLKLKYWDEDNAIY